MLKFDGPDTRYDHLQINLISDKEKILFHILEPLVLVMIRKK